MALVVVGPVDPTRVEQLIAASFADMANRAPARPEPDLGKVATPAGVSAAVHRDPERPASPSASAPPLRTSTSPTPPRTA